MLPGILNPKRSVMERRSRAQGCCGHLVWPHTQTCTVTAVGMAADIGLSTVAGRSSRWLDAKGP